MTWSFRDAKGWHHPAACIYTWVEGEPLPLEVQREGEMTSIMASLGRCITSSDGLWRDEEKFWMGDPVNKFGHRLGASYTDTSGPAFEDWQERAKTTCDYCGCEQGRKRVTCSQCGAPLVKRGRG